jgi:hypothetical protein
MSEEAVNNWHESRETYSGRGRPKTYSDIAVQVCLLFRQLYSLPLRQTQGFVRSLIRLMELPFEMMDFSNISKRSDGLAFERLIDSIEAGSHVIVDSTGLKVYGQDEWHQEKHNVQAKRTWRKLHIAIDESKRALTYLSISSQITAKICLNNISTGKHFPTVLTNNCQLIDFPSKNFCHQPTYLHLQ